MTVAPPVTATKGIAFQLSACPEETPAVRRRVLAFLREALEGEEGVGEFISHFDEAFGEVLQNGLQHAVSSVRVQVKAWRTKTWPPASVGGACFSVVDDGAGFNLADMVRVEAEEMDALREDQWGLLMASGFVDRLWGMRVPSGMMVCGVKLLEAQG